MEYEHLTAAVSEHIDQATDSRSATAIPDSADALSAAEADKARNGSGAAAELRLAAAPRNSQQRLTDPMDFGYIADPSPTPITQTYVKHFREAYD